MKKTMILLLLYILCASIPFFAMAEDTEFVPMDDYVEGEILIAVEFVIDLSEYEGEGPYDFYGVSVMEFEHSDDLFAAEEEFEKFGVVSYKLILSSSEDTLEAFEILKQCGEIYFVELNYFIPPDEGTIETSIGDVNADGVIDVFDCLMIRSIYFETYEATSTELLLADINGDGEIDMFDYLEVKAIYFEQ